jgi:UDP-N-acetylmuramoyl-tripeptide--D-alanyl-D-alanine ligase
MAAAVALVLGVPIQDVALGLTEAAGASWRMQLDRSPAGLTVLNDAYNASPTAVAAALRSFARLPGVRRRAAVLGEMLELGDCAPAEHETVGRLAGELGFDAVVAVGHGARDVATGARAAGVREVVEVPSAAGALEAIAALVGPEDAVLVKASRAVGLEVVADALVAGAADGHTAGCRS